MRTKKKNARKVLMEIGQKSKGRDSESPEIPTKDMKQVKLDKYWLSQPTPISNT